jgi:ribosome-associated protein
MKPSHLEITPFVFIALSEFEFSFVRSSGPGGQNVNKVNSKAVLRWSLRDSASINEDTRARLLSKLETKLTLEQELIVSCDNYRDQPQNKAACIDKFKYALIDALHVPKRRKKTKPSYSRTKKDEASKKHHSEKKKMRKVDY